MKSSSLKIMFQPSECKYIARWKIHFSHLHWLLKVKKSNSKYQLGSYLFNIQDFVEYKRDDVFD